MTRFQVVHETKTSNDDDDLIHIFHDCDENVAFCGVDVSGAPIKGWDSYPDPDDCIVCEEIDQSGRCPWCGI